MQRMPVAAIREECPFENEDNVSYGITISPEHQPRDTSETQGDKTVNQEEEANPQLTTRDGDTEIEHCVSEKEKTAGEQFARANTRGAVDVVFDNRAECPQTRHAAGVGAGAEASIYEEMPDWESVSATGREEGPEEMERDGGLEETEEPEVATKEEELSGTVAQSDSDREEDSHIYDDHVIPTRPYYSIIFDGEDEGPGKTTAGTDGEMTGPYYSVVQGVAAMQTAEEVVYHYSVVQGEAAMQTAEEVVYHYTQCGQHHDKVFTPGEGYVNVGSGTNATQAHDEMESGYVNVDPGTLATHYANVDIVSMAMGFKT